MGCDLCGAKVGRGDGVVVWTRDCLNCDFWDLGRWAVISLAAMLGVGMEVLSGLDCDFWDFERWAVISLAAMLGAWGGSVVWTGL